MNEIHSAELTALIGLGNPGKRFDHTRHNIGFMVVDALADAYGARWQEKDQMAIADILIDGRRLILIKPLTFMNNSGDIMPALSKKGIKAENILVIHDELEKPFGTIALRMGGSHRGHNGLRSIIDRIGPDFGRMRIGIGRPADKSQVSDYVLARFDENEQAVANQVQKAVEMIENLIKE